MSRVIQALNLIGILILAGLCWVQWQTNRQVNLEAKQLDKIRLQQVAKIAEQDQAIKGYAADLEDFRQRLTLSEASLKESEEKFRQLSAERDKLLAERDQLKLSLDKFTAALAERDAALKKSAEQIQKLSEDRNEAVTKFNDLAEKYNALVKDLEKSQKKPGSSG
jgi:chromosome segregation ATPase